MNPVMAFWVKQDAVHSTARTTQHAGYAVVQAPPREASDFGIAHRAEAALFRPEKAKKTGAPKRVPHMVPFAFLEVGFVGRIVGIRVEGGLWVIGVILYLRATHTRGFAGHPVLWTFIVVFTVLWLLSFNGAPPPSIHILVTVDLILFPIVFGWAYLIDYLRQPNETSAHV